ncbi:hypothetical protein QL285_055755 [Trifolium repens]|nr:hypothetical protein QL285_055755 [Trifolium repens]
MLLEQCNLCQGQAATATDLKSDPAMNGLEVKTDTPSTPPPPTPSGASSTLMRLPPRPTLMRTSEPPNTIWSPPKRTNGQTAHTEESHPPRDRSRKKYLTRPPPSAEHDPQTICPLSHLPP